MWEGWGRVVCWWAPATAVPGGKWIPFSAKQVALRRAARLVCAVIGFGSGEAVLAPAALPAVERVPSSLGVFYYEYPPGFFVQGADFSPELSAAFSPVPFFSTSPSSFTPGTNAPEPSSVFILLIGLGVLVAINEGKRQAMSNRHRPENWPEPPRRIEPLTEDDRDPMAPGLGVILGLILGSTIWIVIIAAVLTFLPAWKMGML